MHRRIEVLVMPDRQLVEDGRIVAIRELGGGAAVAVVAGYAAAVLYPDGASAGRVLIMAVAAGWFAARCTDWRVRVAVMVICTAVFSCLPSMWAVVQPGRNR